MQQKIIGIDLGTSNSCVSVFEGLDVMVIGISDDRTTLPSVVAFTPSGLKIGEPARRQAVIFPRNTISSVKRLMGKSYHSVEGDLAQFAYQVDADKDGAAVINIDGRQLSPQEVSAHILAVLKERASAYLDMEVSDAVITVPAYFTERQRSATEEAARIAGLNPRAILNEPTAAALAYNQSGEHMGRIVVFDFGGGTFDISILNCDQDYDVLATGGDTHLGGDDIDKALADYVIGQYYEERKEAAPLSPEQLFRIREEAERVKRKLSDEKSTEFTLSYFSSDPQRPHFVRIITRALLNDLIRPLLERCMEICKTALDSRDIKISDIDHVLLVGGSTKIPAVREMVQSFFGIRPSFSKKSDEIVAMGAAIRGAMINGSINDRHLLDVTPLALGLWAKDPCSGLFSFCPVIPENTTIPYKEKQTFEARCDQRGFTVMVVQGRNALDATPEPIGWFDVFDLTPSENGMAEVEVLFDMNANGLLAVSARNLASGRTHSINIEHAGSHSRENLQAKREELSRKMEEMHRQQWAQDHPGEPDGTTPVSMSSGNTSIDNSP